MPSTWSGLATLQGLFSRQLVRKISKADSLLAKALLCVQLCLLCTVSFAQESITYDVQGVEDAKLRNNIRLHLSGLDVEKALLTDPYWQDEVAEAVATAVQPYGFYNSETKVRIQEGDKVTVTVSLNTPLTINKVTREIIGAGREDKAFRERFNSLKLKEGDVLNQTIYESFKSSMFNYALSNGYFDYFWQATRLDLVRDEKQANVLLIAQSGPQYKFGELKFVGDDKAKAIIKRLKPFKTGDAYSSSVLGDFNRRLNQSGYFNRVIARPVVSDAEGLLVPIEVSLQHRPTDAFNVSVGAATDTGPRVRLGWERPWVNDKGHSVSSDIFISEPEQSVTADYRIPMKNITRDYASIEAGYQFIEYANTSFESETLSLSAHRYTQQDGSPWQHDYSVTYLRETYDQGDLDTNTTSLVLPGYSLTYRDKDDELNIGNGTYVQVLAQYGKEGFGSDIDYAKTAVEGMLIRTFANKHRITLRGEIGAIKTNSFDDVPASLRFYAGGDQSVRGFSYRDLSPKADVINPETGELDLESIGGKYLVTSSIEYAYSIADNWRIAAFVDAGKAANDISDSLAYGIGPGVHWLSPIGAVRVYLARGLSKQENDWRIHIILGPEL
ncbi:autotransporter assembly complex protein TamA [Alteromonas macleodii]|uniref:Autotransporter secretion outer membrane protein TamA n=1 Tax=Alteromonas macleodii TaxID=28108 RepID=A0A6T9Y7P9_ALTMA|nr:autotransporter assembly complex family protein [Alteromonas macleodii]CAB9495960.1 Autotransporter secretion outer membrane protein TamA [Alteromonas macleodii]